MPSRGSLTPQEEASATSEQTSDPDPTLAVALVCKTEMPPALVCDAEADAAPLRLRQLGPEEWQATRTNASPWGDPIVSVTTCTLCNIRRYVTAGKGGRLPSRRMDTQRGVVAVADGRHRSGTARVWPGTTGTETRPPAPISSRTMAVQHPTPPSVFGSARDSSDTPEPSSAELPTQQSAC
jgi:hypothetical protein